ncbi:hypothetical protein NEA10_05615 [Phormidium yuhuli AB48]|uniref:Anti-sigma factor n=1 Tax=Phormidium yuhuli AB48 TaxID=2940671 RepID=A0ABY5AV45_9CYAN|nr:hypothetical protein [Phormidium yuhuli]USR92201.1 hypothetical protein NEA10_05615 [Phormidium yuhuli AB48]
MTLNDFDDQLRNRPSSYDAEWEEDLFVLMSCYLDGEVTPQERKQAEYLLACDLQAQKIYEQLSHISSGVQLMPVPESPVSSEETTAKVFARMRQQRQKRLAWGGSAIAALFVAAVAGLQPPLSFSNRQLARTPAPVSDEFGAPTPSEPVPTSDQQLSRDDITSRALFVE